MPRANNIGKSNGKWGGGWTHISGAGFTCSPGIGTQILFFFIEEMLKYQKIEQNINKQNYPLLAHII